MKKLLSILCLSLSTLAHADWTVIAESVSGTVFEMTAENAAVLGSEILVWERSTSQDRTFHTVLNRYDCDQIRYKTHEIFAYDMAGNLVNHGVDTNPAWKSIAPGMVSNTLRQVACTVRARRKEVFMTAHRISAPPESQQDFSARGLAFSADLSHSTPRVAPRNSRPAHSRDS